MNKIRKIDNKYIYICVNSIFYVRKYKKIK